MGSQSRNRLALFTYLGDARIWAREQSGLEKLTSKTEFNLSICAIFRNEAPYLEEWINFHLQQGVEHFFLINDASTDDYLEALAPFLRKGNVTLVSSKKWDQVFEYNRVLKKYGKRTKWLAYIDIDEFLFSPNGESIPDALKELEQYSSVWVGWKIYGSSGHIEEPAGVIRNFLECAQWPANQQEKQRTRDLHRSLRGDTNLTGAPFNGKSVIQPLRIRKMGIHKPESQLGESFADRELQNLRINHYWSRSISKLHKKASQDPVSKEGRLRKPHGSLVFSWETHLSQSLDPIALRLTDPEEFPFVIFIGFNKTGTRAIDDLMRRNNFQSVHWDANKLVATMLRNRSKGLRLLSGYEDYRCFSDLTYLSDTFYFEGNSLFRELKRDYPDAFFILNNRDTDAWLQSRLAHNNGLFAARHKKIRGLDSDGELIAEWEREKRSHEKAVREFFSNDPHFLELDIDSDEVSGQIGKLLNLDLGSTFNKIGVPRQSS